MHKNKIVSLHLVLASVLLIAACGDKKVADKTGDDGTDKGKDKHQICYSNNSICIEAFEGDEIAAGNKAYVYPNPKTFPDKDQQEIYAAPALQMLLNPTIENKAISKNFKVGEFMSSAKGAFGYVAPHLVQTLQNMRDGINKAMRITSGFRSPGYNAGVSGSAKWSRHTYGDAVDIQIPSANLATIKELCEQQDASFVLVYEAHVHCDWRLVGQKADRISRYRTIAAAHLEDAIDATGDVKISVKDLQSEDPEELVYEWSVLYPDGSTQTANTPTLHLLRPSGEYKVSVIVGMTVQLDGLFKY